jgi:hypothetical protein
MTLINPVFRAQKTQKATTNTTLPLCSLGHLHARCGQKPLKQGQAGSPIHRQVSERLPYSISFLLLKDGVILADANGIA